jgi:hypothetical protein
VAGRISTGVGVGVTKGVGVGENCCSFFSLIVSSCRPVPRDFRGMGVGVGLFPKCEMERPTLLKKSPNELAAMGGPLSAKATRENRRTNLGTTRTIGLAFT